MNGVRYEPVQCAKCGDTYQMIDFHGNPHAWFCGGDPSPADIEQLAKKYPQVTFWNQMPAWQQRLEHLRALRRPLTDQEWIEFCALEARR